MSDVASREDYDRLVAQNPPPPRRRFPVLPFVALCSAIIALVSFGIFFRGLTGFSGNWNGPLPIRSGRSGNVWFVVEHAWTYLVPALVIMVVSTLSLFTTLITHVVRQGRKATPSR